MRSGTMTLLMIGLAERRNLLAFMPAALTEAVDFLQDSAERLCEEHLGSLFCSLDLDRPMLAVFPFASSAIEMASEVFRALNNQPWCPTRPLCRAAIVTGDIVYEEEAIKGDVTLTLAALLEIARPGQILVGEATRFLVRQRPPEDHGFLSLGFNHLEDGQRGQTLYQLLHPELPYEFQPLTSMLTAASNLPQGNTPFIGRKDEITAVKEGFYHAKVVSLIGFDGVGKTRLATKVASEMLEDHYHGACYVDLCSAQTETQIYNEVAVALGVRPYHNDSTSAAVIDRLRNSEMLLVLDNVDPSREHGVRVISRIVDMCPRIQILNTSNRLLPLPFMFAYPVHPMNVPNARGYTSLEELSQIDSVALFVSRVAMRDQSFELSLDNAQDIAALCRKLEGIPLAIELAAARAAELQLPNLARGLEDRFALLDGRGKHGRAKLEASLRWSYKWLSDAEQKLLNRLIVFSGEFTPNGARAVAVWDPLQDDEFDPLLENLVMFGFVRRNEQGGGTYLEVLETIREFCRPYALSEINLLMERHADWYANISPVLVTRMNGPDQGFVASQIDQTYQNYILALNWLLDSPDDQRAVEILSLLHRYWLLRCLYSEGYHWSETVLNQKSNLPAEVRGRIHCIAGVLGGLCGAFERAEKHFRDAEAIGKKENLPDLLMTAHRVSGDNLLLGGSLAAAAAAQKKALDIALEIGNQWEVADSSLALANVLTDLGRFEDALELAARSLDINVRLQRTNRVAWSRLCLGRCYRLMGLFDEPIEELGSSLHQHGESGDNRGIVEVLREFVLIRIKSSSFHSGAVILGAEEAFRKTHQVPVSANRRAEMEKAVRVLKQTLGNHFLYEFEKGAMMTLPEIEEFLLVG